jgi:hypothetical protein
MSVRDALVALLFVAGLALPSLAALFGSAKFDTRLEKREPAPWPAFRMDALATFPGAVERWFADRFGFRAAFVRWTSRAKVAMGVSPSSKVIIGHDGFLFYAGEHSLELYQRALPFSESELVRWQTALEARRAALARRGIRYLVFFPPDKEGIYARYMPGDIRRLSIPSELDQLLTRLADRTSVTAVDVRPPIERARRAGLVYWKTDTHWNGRGSFSAYRTVMGRIHDWFPETGPLSQDAVSFVTGPAPGGDLSAMLGLPEDLPEGIRLDCSVRAPRAMPADTGMTPDPKTLTHLLPQAFHVDDARLPRALLLGDSFMGWVVPLLAENFSRTLFIGGHSLDEGVVVREDPDVVIEEWVERYIQPGPPGNGPWIEHPGGGFSRPRHLDEAHAPGQPLPPIASWSGHDVRRVEDDGALEATGQDPYLQTVVRPFDAEPSLSVWVPLTAVAATPEQVGQRSAQLFWSVNGARFSEAASLRFPILVDGVAHTYRVAPSFSRGFQGRITSVRIDFPDGAPGVRYRLGEVEISPPLTVR